MAKLRPAMGEQMSRTRMVTVFGASPIPGLGVAGGFKLMVEDRGDLGLPTLADSRPTTWSASFEKQVPGLVGVSTQFRSNTPQLFLDIDRQRPRRWACRSTT